MNDRSRLSVFALILLDLALIGSLASSLSAQTWFKGTLDQAVAKAKKAVWEIRSALNSVRYKALVEGTSFRVKLCSDSYSVEKYEESIKIWMLAEKHIYNFPVDDRVRHFGIEDVFGRYLDQIQVKNRDVR